MSKLEWTPALNRKARVKPLKELATPTWELAREAIKTGQVDDALELLEYFLFESKFYYESAMSMVNSLLILLVENAGEEAVNEFWRKRSEPRAVENLAASKIIENAIIRISEGQRGHFGTFAITEERDRFVMACNPCGSGGGMRQKLAMGKTKQAHPWSWNKTGVSLYCVHCAIGFEILPIELRGYPLKITEYVNDDKAPCVSYFYKKPELIPDKYFTRVGKVKDPSKFK